MIATKPIAPADYRGPLYLPTGRMVWFTGKVAIGLRYVPPSHTPASNDAEFLQSLLLKGQPCAIS